MALTCYCTLCLLSIFTHPRTLQHFSYVLKALGEQCIRVDRRFDNQKEDNVMGLCGIIKSVINFRFHRNSEIMAAPTLMTPE